MKVAIWTAAPLAYRQMTGVGKHMVQMSLGLNARDDMEVTLLLPTGGLEVHESSRPLLALPSVRLGLGETSMRYLWASLSLPTTKFWVPEAEWVYCPRELWIPPGNSRLAVTVHDLWPLERETLSFKDWAKWRWLLGRALRRADLVLTVSEFTSQRVQSLFGIDAHRIRVVGNGAADAFFKNGTRRPGDIVPSLDGRCYGIAVGGLSRKKGGDRLIAFAHILKRHRPEIMLVLVGPKEREFSTTGLPTNVVHLPRGLPDDDLADLVRGAAFACPLSRYEGFGITVAEAMAAGTPVIASNIPSHREVAGDAALFVDADDPTAVCSAVERLLDCPTLAEEVRDKGFQRAKLHTWSSAVQRLHSALKEFSR